MTHKLNVNPAFRPMKQKKRSFGLKRSEIIKEKVKKLLTTGYIHAIQYPEWLANVVLVPKQNKKSRMCIDFMDLNRACPKDSYPLPRIDALIDSTTGCEMMSFLDAFQGYNQISLEPEDQEKTSFITEQDIFCYHVMPFGLKNPGATYQRLSGVCHVGCSRRKLWQPFWSSIPRQKNLEVRLLLANHAKGRLRPSTEMLLLPKQANCLHNPAAFMKTLESPCPFDMWGMDIVEKLPRAVEQKEYLIVAVDYFTKWVEAEPLAKISEKEVIKFIWQNIICRLGIPRVLITDDGMHFQGGKLKSWLEELKIKQFFTSINNPQANGQAEVTNRIILQQLKTRSWNAKGDWVHELLGVLWAYHTTPRQSTQETPFNLEYGTKAMLPAEIGEETWRIKSYDSTRNSKSRR
ncbi:UNVERIFIED_CONTAM: putative enzymatic polyprotein [Sesamum latifolium]|uniref:Enzymatic polyprotein n=1 Tax=Sesamum latifolium TaxID=2727402 RepID=A0AAW2UT33_9LAMI